MRSGLWSIAARLVRHLVEFNDPFAGQKRAEKMIADQV